MTCSRIKVLVNGAGQEQIPQALRAVKGGGQAAVGKQPPGKLTEEQVQRRRQPARAETSGGQHFGGGTRPVREAVIENRVQLTGEPDGPGIVQAIPFFYFLPADGRK